MDLFAHIAALRRERRPAALATVVETHGSTPRKPGARMLVHHDGQSEGSVGGGAVEQVVREAAARVLRTGRAELVTYKLTHDLAMCCGGQMTLFVEPIMSPPPLIVFGCGHVGRAVVYAAAPLGFDIVAVDDLRDNANPERLPQATRIIHSYEAADFADLPFGDDAFVVIATREHALDQKLIEYCLARPSRFLGVIGSPRKAHLQAERLRAKGFAPEAIARVRCPLGVDIGAETPEEIAVSVTAELVAVRRGGPRFTGR